MKTLLFPDPESGTPAGAVPVDESLIIHKPTLPRKDDDIRDTGRLVSDHWATQAQILLVWITQPQFAQLITDYTAELDQRKQKGASRSPITDALDTVDEQIDDAIPYVKGYIAGKYGMNHASAHYSVFGIVHHDGEWQFPVDHNVRKESLQMMVDAIAAEGFGANEFGTAFWTATQTTFNNLLTQANTTDEEVSGKVSSKNQMKQKIKKVLQSLVYVLHGNYPDTYRATLRTWGLQKEDY